jgi:hypothetical protein
MSAIPTDFTELWQLTTRWASQPVAGVLLPSEIQGLVATEVLERAIDSFAVLPAKTELLAYLQAEARDSALRHTARLRFQQKNASLYREDDWRPGGPGLQVVDLTAELAGVRNAAWASLVQQLRPVVMPILLRQGVAEQDVEELYFKILAELDQPKANGRRALEDMHVYEQIPRLVAVMARNKAVDHLRAVNRLKNAPNSARTTDSLEADEELGHSIVDKNSTRWLDDPFSALTFDQIFQGCRDVLDQLQWSIVTRLFVEEQTVLHLCEDDGLMKKLEVSPKASEATKRRRVGDHLRTALDGLAGCLQSRDLWPS